MKRKTERAYRKMWAVSSVGRAPKEGCGLLGGFTPGENVALVHGKCGLLEELWK